MPAARSPRSRRLRTPGSTALAIAAAVHLCAGPGCVPSTTPVACADSVACPATHFCDFGTDACGHEGARGVCARRPVGCMTIVATACGCDGVTYDNPCLAQAGGADVAHEGACGGPCAPDDVHASGTCGLALGWFWDGASCYAASGCTCVGLDCAGGGATRSACEDAHVACHPGLDAGSAPTSDAAGTTDADRADDAGAGGDA